ncbi:tripartite tricarboxylate transporter substrate binding protein [Roseomonas stagni]|uniref:Tripartite tricarboxylate transporter substrate binding protein n=1 Tax=Falsiroseomonas algicola TaxID=2716930 RepID=A0A6M1LNC6_9PROT|nr:tripartite tricarboxylate transporter substrate binding protein [Falsiroseomonas algicola]NGM21284.1 tripartite tricarboxylate transporter substrate binding protein [Falsiroseomonas algicola]
MLSRRLLIAATTLALPGLARAQGRGALRIIMPFPPGQGSDILMRLLAERLQGPLGQPVIVENRPGAGGTLGMEYAANATPDGNTIVMGGSGPTTIAGSLFPRLGYDTQRDLTPIALIASVPQLFIVNNDFPVRDIQGLIARAKANPGGIFYASSGNGTTQHLNVELFKTLTGTEMTHVPYRGSGPALADLVAGQVPFMSDTLAAVTDLVRTGRVRAIGVTSKERSPFFPDVPTIAEQGVAGYESVGWISLLGPRGLPDAQAARIEQAVEGVLRQADFQARLADQAFTATFLNRTDFAAFIRSEITKWAQVVRAADVKVD